MLFLAGFVEVDGIARRVLWKTARAVVRYLVVQPVHDAFHTRYFVAVAGNAVQGEEVANALQVGV